MIRKIVVALAAALALAGCSGASDTSTGSSTAQTTPAASESPVSYEHRHHHHRRHHGTNLAAAPQGSASDVTATGSASPGGSWPCNDQQFQTDQQQFASGQLQGDQEVDVCGTVTNVLPARDTRSGLHGYYVLQVVAGDTIEIVCDLGEMDAPAWPWVKSGDYSYVQGRYYYDSSGSQGIDWTHHGTSRSWTSPGYVVIDGTQYQ
jgi:hypothetical protein